MSWFGEWDGFDEEMQKAPDIFARKPQTNADRIRAMTDEELAEVLCLIVGGLGPVSSSDGCDWLEWLKEEAKESDEND